MRLLEVDGLVVRYGSGASRFTAVEDVSLDLSAGETLGIVGESGSGKSTLARAIVGIAPIASGRVVVDGVDTRRPGRAERRHLCETVQMVFQDPASCLDPRMTIGQSLTEALAARGRIARGARGHRVVELLEMVGLEQRYAELLPRLLSGGQRQRVAIARTLAVEPSILIADEITSALDVSVQGAILNLLKDLQRELGLALMFISHDLAVVRYLCDRIAVMQAGRVVEDGPAAELLANPADPFTRALLEAVSEPSRRGAAVPR
jgi:peptide/nickel transport system ATP-binding protein